MKTFHSFEITANTFDSGKNDTSTKSLVVIYFYAMIYSFLSLISLEEAS